MSINNVLILVKQDYVKRVLWAILLAIIFEFLYFQYMQKLGMLFLSLSILLGALILPVPTLLGGDLYDQNELMAQVEDDSKTENNTEEGIKNFEAEVELFFSFKNIDLNSLGLLSNSSLILHQNSLYQFNFQLDILRPPLS